MKLSICFLCVLLSILPVHAADTQRFHPNHLFIKMKNGQKLIKSSLIHQSIKIIDGLYLVETSSPEALSFELKNNKSIEYTQKDFFAEKKEFPKLQPLDIFAPSLKTMMYPMSTASIFNDPRVPELWAFSGKYGMNVLEAYTTLPRRTPEEVIVAVIDTGVDYNHEDLRDVMWVNHGEIPGDKIDNDDNGYVDDIYGINTLTRDAKGKATSEVMGSHWHGTHVSGTIAATQNNGIGIAGIANNAKIMALKTVPDDADELDSNIVESIMYAAKNGARIINCSFGKKANEGGMVVRDVITEVGLKNNVLVVVSAGNDSMGPFSQWDNDVKPKYPASFDSENMLVVAATQAEGKLTSFSNVGAKTVDVAAPGMNILSTVKGGGYASANGTSMAAPNVTGVATILLGYNPDLSAIELKKLIMKTVTKANDLKDKMVSGGRVNLAAAFKKLTSKK